MEGQQYGQILPSKDSKRLLLKNICTPSSCNENERYKRLCKLTNVLAKSSSRSVHTYPPIQKPDTNAEQVTMSITHDELPAARDAEVMQQYADLTWADNVQSIIQARATEPERVQQQQLSNEVHLISFRSGKGSRCSFKLRVAHRSHAQQKEMCVCNFNRHEPHRHLRLKACMLVNYLLLLCCSGLGQLLPIPFPRSVLT